MGISPYRFWALFKKAWALFKSSYKPFGHLGHYLEKSAVDKRYKKKMKIIFFLYIIYIRNKEKKCPKCPKKRVTIALVTI